MSRYFRSSAFRLALGYISVSIAVLALFAAPLWYAWRENVEQVRTELLREDVQSLTDIFQNQGPEVLAAGVSGGFVIRRALLSEVHRIRQTTCAIVEGDFSRRLPAQGGSDELDLLAQTVNRMLDQIEQLVHGVRNVSNAIAHDLRTP